jgi:hypothetical protein
MDKAHLRAQMVQMVITAYSKHVVMKEADYVLERRLRRELEDALANNPERRQLQVQLKEWAQAAKEAAVEVFPPGTVIVDSVDAHYYVVDTVLSGGELDCRPVVAGGKRAQRSVRVRITDKIRIVDIEDLPQKYQKIAGQLIAEIRMKDW